MDHKAPFIRDYKIVDTSTLQPDRVVKRRRLSASRLDKSEIKEIRIREQEIKLEEAKERTDKELSLFVHQLDTHYHGNKDDPSFAALQKTVISIKDTPVNALSAARCKEIIDDMMRMLLHESKIHDKYTLDYITDLLQIFSRISRLVNYMEYLKSIPRVRTNSSENIQVALLTPLEAVKSVDIPSKRAVEKLWTSRPEKRLQGVKTPL